MKECVLVERVCQACGECLRCDLDPQKTCDNCCMCLDEADYNGVLVDGVVQTKAAEKLP